MFGNSVRSLPNYREGSVHLGELKLFYRRFGQPYGSAPTVLLLHGGWATGTLNWSHCYGHMANQFHVVSPDHRGHGKSNSPLGKLSSYTLLAWDIIGLCQELGIDQVITIGHSSGALISLHISTIEPELIKRQMLIGVHPEIGRSPKHREGMMKFFHTSSYDVPPSRWRYLLNHPLRAIALWWIHTDPGWYELLTQAWPLWVKPLQLEESDYAKIVAPTTILMGTDDEFGTVEEAAKFKQLISHLQFQEVEQADHMFVIDRPELFRPYLDAFLASSKH